MVWAPHVVAHDGKYWMFYCAGGKSHEQFHIHMATSSDLVNWTRHPANPMVVDGYDARDPMVARVGEQWVLYYCATETPQGGHHVVKAMTSPRFDPLVRTAASFSARRKRAPSAGPPSRPLWWRGAGKYYLFVCTNAPYNTSAAYKSDDPVPFRHRQHRDDLSRPWRGSDPCG